MNRRFTLANLAIVVVAILALELPLALVYSRHEHDALNSGLDRDATALSLLATEAVEHPASHDLSSLARSFSVGGEIAVVVDRRGQTLTPPSVADGDPAMQAALRVALQGVSQRGEVDDLVYLVRPVRHADRPAGAVLIARPDRAIDDRVRRFWLLLVGVGALLLLASLAMSLRLGRWVSRPLRRLDDNAVAFGRGDLTVRADTRSGPPEVTSLALTFNEMAARLDELVQAQRRLVADASHQLRSPLTALQLRLENLDAGSVVDLEATRDAALRETGRLAGIVEGLLALARAEGQRPTRARIELWPVLVERALVWSPLAAERGLAIELLGEPAAPVAAQLVPGHLEQILDNLIDNAFDASPAGGTIELGLGVVDATVEIHVKDAGRGMTDDELSRAFDSFWRSPRSPSPQGTGLGLSIAQQLARANSGVIVLAHNQPHGVDASLRLHRAV
jgi:signal transduction histidine kinase